MAIYNAGVDISLVAAVDMNNYQYRFVRCGSVAGEFTYGAAAVGGSILGVLQNDPRAGEGGTIRIVGGTRVLGDAASALSYGSFVKAGSDGAALGCDTATASMFVSGIAMEALASGCAYVEILLTPNSVRYV